MVRAACSTVAVRRAGMILAGGRSQRMGQPKAWLDLNGEPLLAAVCRAIGVAVDSVVVVGTAGEALPELPAGVIRVDDPPARQHCGPLAGVITGLEALADPGPQMVFIGSCDAAWLTTTHVGWMLDALAATPAWAAIVPVSTAPDGARLLHATSGAVRLPAALDAARSLFASDRHALWGLYDSMDAHCVPITLLPDPEAVRPCNTHAQWQAARAARARP